jgi:hypothetical protein
VGALPQVEKAEPKKGGDAGQDAELVSDASSKVAERQ